MSADLFAAFGDAPQAQSTQQTPSNSNAISAASDPFSFLSFHSSASQPQSSQKSAPWPLLQQPTAGHTTSQPQASRALGDNGVLDAKGGIGGFGNQTTSFSVAQKTPQPEEDDDGWGDFEVAPANPSPQPAVSSPTATAGGPRTRVTRASTFDMLSNKLLDLDLETSAPEPWQSRPSWEKNERTQQPQQPARNPDPNVLFDADFETGNGTDGGDDDEFGDFETGAAGAPTSQTGTTKPAVDLLSLDPVPAPTKKQPPGLSLSNAALRSKPSSYPEAPKSPYGSFKERKPEPVKQLQVQPPVGGRVFREPNQASPSPITAWPSVEHDGFGNKWEEFKDLPDSTGSAGTKPTTSKPAPGTKTKLASTAPAPVPEWDWQDWGGTDDQATLKTATTTTTTTPAHSARQTQSHAPLQSTTTENPGPPPTNVPPPSILLSIFPQLLDLASSSLLKPLLTLPSSSPAYQRVLSSAATFTFLQGYLSLATVAARLIAGRKHRWHRDKFLAQGMSISAAPSGAAGGGGQRGMKLSALDRSQSAREDGEAAEVVAAWKAQVGRLRAVVAAVNAANAAATQGGRKPLLRVPELALAAAVTTLKGAPTAPRACVVCGLKRDERVAKVDVEVEDSFGEWWVEFWGHRECRNFWLEHERDLRQR